MLFVLIPIVALIGAWTLGDLHRIQPAWRRLLALMDAAFLSRSNADASDTFVEQERIARTKRR